MRATLHRLGEHKIAIPIPRTSATQPTAMVLPLQANGSCYQGPAQVCVSADGQQTCASAPIQIAALNMLTAVPGSTLLAIQQQSAAALYAAGSEQCASAAEAALEAQKTNYTAVHPTVEHFIYAAAVGAALANPRFAPAPQPRASEPN
jgi:hypothetical protein